MSAFEDRLRYWQADCIARELYWVDKLSIKGTRINPFEDFRNLHTSRNHSRNKPIVTPTPRPGVLSVYVNPDERLGIPEHYVYLTQHDYQRVLKSLEPVEKNAWHGYVDRRGESAIWGRKVKRRFATVGTKLEVTASYAYVQPMDGSTKALQDAALKFWVASERPDLTRIQSLVNLGPVESPLG